MRKVTHYRELGGQTWLVAALAIGLGVSCFQAWHDEHHNATILIDQKADVWSKFNVCDKERAVKGALADTYAGQMVVDRTRLDSQQDTFNRCILTLGQATVQERRRIDVKTLDVLNFNGSGGRTLTAWAVLAATNKIITPSSGILTCAEKFELQSFTILDTKITLKTSFHQSQINERQVRFLLGSPPWTPTSPLIFMLTTQEMGGLGDCSINLD